MTRNTIRLSVHCTVYIYRQHISIIDHQVNPTRAMNMQNYSRIINNKPTSLKQNTLILVLHPEYCFNCLNTLVVL